jgi:hypothetical protein
MLNFESHELRDSPYINCLCGYFEILFGLRDNKYNMTLVGKPQFKRLHGRRGEKWQNSRNGGGKDR